MKRTFVLIIIPFIICVIFFYWITDLACDKAMHFDAKKPIPFTHKSHIKLYGADCDSCHSFDSNGRFKGIPTVGDCKVCHDGTTASNKAFFKDYNDDDRPWESYSRQPDLVYFSHIAVVKNSDGGSEACAPCHGDKAVTMATHKINGKMLMGECMRCHTAKNISNACAVCHK